VANTWKSWGIWWGLESRQPDRNVWLLETRVILLLLAHYVPNEAKRSKTGVYDISVGRSIYWGPTDQRPMTDDLTFWKISNPRGVIWSTSCLVLWIGGVFEVGGSNGAISGFAKSKSRHLGKFKWRYLRIVTWRIVRFTPCLVPGWGFRGRRIEWRYFRFCQIQNGGKFKWRYLSGGSSNLLRIWFYDGVFGVGGLNAANSGLTKFNRYVGENSVWRVIRLVTI